MPQDAPTRLSGTRVPAGGTHPRLQTSLQRLRRKAAEVPFFSRVRVRLMALVLIAVLPALGLIFYTAYEQRRLGIEAARQEVQRLIRLAAQRQNELIEGARQLLVTLSHHQEIIELEPNHCEQLLAELLSIHQVYANFGIALPDGRVIISAVPLTNEVNIADRSYFKDAIEHRHVAIGDYQIGRITGKPGLNIGCPVFDFDGKIQAVIYAALDLSWFPRFVQHVNLPSGSSLTLSDRHRVTLARYPDPEGKYVGQQIGSTNQSTAPLLRTNLPPQRDRTVIATGRDGIRRLYAFTILGGREGDPRPAGLALGIPVSVAFADANRALARNLTMLALVTCLALGAAWYVGDILIVRRLRELVGVTRRLSTGELEARAPGATGDGELQELARAFNDMAAAIQQRDDKQKQTEAQLIALNQRLYQLNADLEQRVEARTVELRRSNTDLQQFAYVASHDLQEPLRMVTHFMQLLQQRFGDRLDTNGHEFIGFALDGAQRMQALIQDLLTYSRVGTHGKSIEAIECQPLLDRVLDNLKLAVQESQATIQRSPLPVVWGDPVQLSQVFQNLISNALKFRGDAPPRIDITAGPADKPEVLPAGHPGANSLVRWYVFTVRDNGLGIAPQDFERIFVVFQRLHSRDKYPGTGIGLSICKKIVERHGGRIWVESEPGQGAAFRFTIPGPGPETDLQTGSSGA